MLVNICMKFHEGILNGFWVSERTRPYRKIYYFQFQRAITPKIRNPALRFLRSARRLMLLYICVKFHKNISNGFWVTERTRFCDRRTDGRTDDPGKNNMSPNPKGGRHNMWVNITGYQSSKSPKLPQGWALSWTLTNLSSLPMFCHLLSSQERQQHPQGLSVLESTILSRLKKDKQTPENNCIASDLSICTVKTVLVSSACNSVLIKYRIMTTLLRYNLFITLLLGSKTISMKY